MPKFLFFCSLILSLNVQSKDEQLELSAENLSFLVLKNSSKDSVDQYVQTLMRRNHQKEYFRSFKDKKKRSALKEKVKRTLLEKIKNIDIKQTFILKRSVKIIKYDNSKSTIKIKNFVKSAVQIVLKNNNTDDVLPSRYTLLYANQGIFSNFKIDKNLYLKHVMPLAENKQINQLYLEATLVVSSYQNKSSFQVAAKEISLYTDINKKIKLATKTDTRSFENITQNWLFSNGITLDLVGIHAFSVLGYRLHDALRYNKNTKAMCSKIKKVAKYQLIRCHKPFTADSTFVSEYLDGKLSLLKLIAKPSISLQEQKKIISTLSFSLKKPKSYFDSHEKNWQAFKVNFTYKPMVFEGQTINTILDNEITVFTMVSHQVLKIMENNP